MASATSPSAASLTNESSERDASGSVDQDAEADDAGGYAALPPLDDSDESSDDGSGGEYATLSPSPGVRGNCNEGDIDAGTGAADGPSANAIGVASSPDGTSGNGGGGAGAAEPKSAKDGGNGEKDEPTEPLFADISEQMQTQLADVRLRRLERDYLRTVAMTRVGPRVDAVPAKSFLYGSDSDDGDHDDNDLSLIHI